MSRISMVLKLTATDEVNPESAQVYAKNNEWRSAPGGWLSHQSGVWNQLPDGIHLMDPTNRETVALLLACNFTLGSEGDRGQAQYPTTAKVGSWEVTATFP